MTNMKRYISVLTVGLLCVLLWCLPESNPSFAEVESVFTQDAEPSISGGDVPVSDSVSDNVVPVSDTVSDNEVETESDEYEKFAIADVDNYVNVRSIPSTDGEILGKMYDGCVAQIIAVAKEDEEWLQVVSGSVEGYIKSEYFICGQDAAAVMEEYVTRYANVEADRLNVRENPSLDAKRIGFLNHGEKIHMLADEGEWIKVEYASGKEGYVSAEYVTLTEEYQYAKSIEEERKEMEALKERQQRQQTSEAVAPENTQVPLSPDTNYSSNDELRNAIVNRALQFVGYPYVHGGQSLATGTDCSGFTCFIYAEFGYSISRTPGGQYSSAGRNISYDQIKPGDIICYSANGGRSCTHVAIYIGDGMMVHAATPEKGVVTMSATYDMIIAVKNLID